MNKLIFLSIFSVGVLFAVGQALQCYKCDLCIGIFEANVTCNAGEQCFSGIGKAVGFIDVKTKGCLKAAECGTTSVVNIPGTSGTSIYNVTKTCCDTDLCNGAPGLAHLGTLPLAVASLLTLLTTRALV